MSGSATETVQGQYVPGAEQSNDYYRNPGEAFAEAYAWYHYGASLVDWEFVSSLRPQSRRLRRDRTRCARTLGTDQARVRRAARSPGERKVDTLRLENDGLVKVRMTGGGDLDIGLLDNRGRFVAVSTRQGTAREKLNFLACGERKLKSCRRRPPAWRLPPSGL